MALRVSRLRRFHCLACHHPMEAGDVGALSVLACPSCKKQQTVPARMHDLILQGRRGPVVAGELFAGVEESSGRDVDVMVMESDTGPRAIMVNATVRLYKTLAKLDHPYLQHIYRLTASDEHPVIVVEPRAASVASLMGDKGVHPVQLLHLAIQAARAFRAAEAVGLCHMSLQPAHFQLRAEYTVRVMGFSFWNHIFSSQPEKGWASIAPTAYLAPEVAADNRPNAQSDMYSFGVCLLYFLTKMEPSEKQSARDILRIEQDLIPRDFAEVLSQLLKSKPSDRPVSWSEVVGLLKGEGTVASKAISLTDVAAEEDPRERSALARPRLDEMQSGFLGGMMTSEAEFDADDVLGQIHSMADSSHAVADMMVEHMANAKGDGPVDIMARAIMDGEMDDLSPEDIGSGLTDMGSGLNEIGEEDFDFNAGLKEDGSDTKAVEHEARHQAGESDGTPA